MAKVSNQDYSIRRGKLSKDSPVVYRVRRGRQQSYTMKANLNPPSPAQEAHRKYFGKITSVVNAIMADPVQAAEWEQRRKDYNNSIQKDVTKKIYKTTRSFAHFVIASQLEQKEAAKRRRKHITNKLPRGIKLQIKPFSDFSAAEIYEILKARFSVFVCEQHIHYLDEDNIDYLATHFSLRRKGSVIAYARLFPDAEKGVMRVGRMLTLERNKGFGKYLMDQITAEAANNGALKLRLHAQMKAVPFYEKMGFHPVGDIFIEAEIPHLCMEKQLFE